MEIKHELLLTEEELKIIKLGLLGKLDKHSHYWQKAQKLAASISIEVEDQGTPNRGLTEKILLAVETLGSATSQEIVEYLGLDYPNSVSVICSRLYRQNRLERDKTDNDPRNRETQGLAPLHRYRLLKIRKV